MNRKFLIKAGAVRSLADARYFSSRMVDIIGFCFDRYSPNYIKPVEAQEVIKWIEGPKIAGEFYNQSVDEIMNITAILQLDYLQWKGNKPDEKFLAVNLPKIISLDFDKENGRKELNDLINTLDVERDYIMVDSECFKRDLKFLMEAAEKFPVILNISSNNDEVQEILKLFPVTGINFESANEIKTGAKSFQDFDALFELLQ